MQTAVTQHPLPHQNPGPDSGGAAQASAQTTRLGSRVGSWLCQSASLGVPCTHCFLSHTEEMGHVTDHMAKALINPDMGAHPGGQLGFDVCVGKPGVSGGGILPSASYPRAQPPDPAHRQHTHL